MIDDGALCVFVDGFAAPMIVRKSDGGFGYSATDLAAVRHRVRDLHANRTHLRGGRAPIRSF